MKPGDVLLANLPQADGRTKGRPVLCLCSVPPYEDLLACGITTELPNAIESLDEIIALGDEDFRTTGLKATSLVRTAFLALLPQSRFNGRLGFVSESRRRRLLN